MGVTAQQTLSHLRRAEQKRRQAARLRAERLQARIPQAVELLRQKYGVDRILLFGSLASGDLTGHVDVDLAVHGLANKDYFSALAGLMHIFGSPVDLVCLEEAPPMLLERIEEQGAEL